MCNLLKMKTCRGFVHQERLLFTTAAKVRFAADIRASSTVCDSDPVALNYKILPISHTNVCHKHYNEITQEN